MYLNKAAPVRVACHVLMKGGEQVMYCLNTNTISLVLCCPFYTRILSDTSLPCDIRHSHLDVFIGPRTCLRMEVFPLNQGGVRYTGRRRSCRCGWVWDGETSLFRRLFKHESSSVDSQLTL